MPRHKLNITLFVYIMENITEFKDTYFNILTFPVAVPKMELMEARPNFPVNECLLLINTDHIWIISKTKGLSLKIYLREENST